MEQHNDACYYSHYYDVFTLSDTFFNGLRVRKRRLQVNMTQNFLSPGTTEAIQASSKSNIFLYINAKCIFMLLF